MKKCQGFAFFFFLLLQSSPSVKSAASTRCLPELGLVTPAERDPLKSTPVERKPFNVQQVQRRHQEAGLCLVGDQSACGFLQTSSRLGQSTTNFGIFVRPATKNQFDATITSALLAKQ